MEFNLSADQREIQALAREVARAEIEPSAGAWDREHRRFVPPLARGEVLGAFALTEPESDAASLRTTAVPNGDGWTISGSKQWVTNGSYAVGIAQAAYDAAVERYCRDAKITEIYEGTSEIQRLVIARSILGAG